MCVYIYFKNKIKRFYFTNFNKILRNIYANEAVTSPFLQNSIDLANQKFVVRLQHNKVELYDKCYHIMHVQHL